jgi:serine protease Do
MPNLWKNVSFALTAMILGSLVTGLVMSLPRGMRGEAQAQVARTLVQVPPSTQLGRTPVLDQQNLVHAEGLSTAFRNVAEALRPSVVSISTRHVEVLGSRLPPGIPPQFQDLFGRQGPVEREQEGMGSGVIVRPDGYILTNNHVVEDADELTVELFDGRKVPGKIVGTDPPTDLAVVKIDLPGLRAAAIGSSDEIRVGDWVLAIGSPFGLDQTVTAGIISGKNRVQRIIADGNGFEDFLQTDAAINPGNSGGPLVNLRGELVGVNTAILSRTGASAGIGFAIPVSLAEPVLESIIETGEVRRGFLGAQVVDVTPDEVQDFDLKVGKGALIRVVLEDQPAAEAGLQPGDVVVSLDGRPCTGGTQLRNYVASRRPGTVISMAVNRAGRLLNVKVNLRERTDEAMAMFDGGLFGAELVPVTEESARKYGIENLRGGLIVASIKDESPAAEVGLEVGDVLESAAGIPLRSVDQLAGIFTEAKQQGQPLRIIVRRGNRRMILPLLIQ